jgi:cell division protein FtsL
MTFNYAKLDGDSVGHSEDALEQQQSHAERGQTKGWAAAFDRFSIVRWPIALLLLSATLICEISILHKQPKSLQIGAELNGLVPQCISSPCMRVGVAR